MGLNPRNVNFVNSFSIHAVLLVYKIFPLCESGEPGSHWHIPLGLEMGQARSREVSAAGCAEREQLQGQAALGTAVEGTAPARALPQVSMANKQLAMFLRHADKPAFVLSL